MFEPKRERSESVQSTIASAVSKDNEDIDPAINLQRQLARGEMPSESIQTASKAQTDSRNKETVISQPSTCAALGSNASRTVYTVTSIATGGMMTCGLTHAVPKGTLKLGLNFAVSAAESPSLALNTNNSNDAWAYFVAGVNGVANQAGVVKDSHYSSGTITQHYCLDVSAQTKEKALYFSAGLATSSKTNSIYRTTVNLTVTQGCVEKLKVVSATFDTAGVIRPKLTETTDKNLSGEYLSIPVVNAQNAWGIKLNVAFEPKTTNITKVRVGIKSKYGITMSDDNVIGQANSQTQGILTFNELKLPRIGNAPVDGKIYFLIELTGTLEQGTVNVTLPEDGKANYAGVQLFTPLFLTSETITLDTRRYGARDNGGDSWGRASTINWLQSTPFRFDDISALHVKQTATGRSVLGHAGHSDGTQIDMRYADGNGGFSDTLGGANNGAGILTMLTAAQAEVTAAQANITPNSTAAKPNLAQTLRWVMTNRARISSAAVSARRIFIGNDWLSKALIHGQFPNNTMIPGLHITNTLLPNDGPGAWVGMPSIVTIASGHLNHWHISLKAS